MLVGRYAQFDEFATAMAVLDQRVHLAVRQVDAGHQGDRPMPLVIATDRRMDTGHWATVGSDGTDCLDAGFLVIRDDRDRGLLRAAASRPRDRRTEPRPFSVRTRDRAAPGSNAPYAAWPHAPPGSCTPFPEPGWPGWNDRRAVRDCVHARPADGSSTARGGTPIPLALRTPTRQARFSPPP